MPPDDAPQHSQQIEYETLLPNAWRVVTIPRGLYTVHLALLDNVEVLSVIYGLVVMTIGWFFKVVGVVFVVEPKKPAA